MDAVELQALWEQHPHGLVDEDTEKMRPRFQALSEKSGESWRAASEVEEEILICKPERKRQRTTTQTDNQKERLRKTMDLQCMKTHALASTTLTCSPSIVGHFTHVGFRSVLRVVNFNSCRCNHVLNFDLYGNSL